MLLSKLFANNRFFVTVLIIKFTSINKIHTLNISVWKLPLISKRTKTPPAAPSAKYYVWKSSQFWLVLTLPHRDENNQINLRSGSSCLVPRGVGWIRLCWFPVSSLMFNQWERHDCSEPRSQEAWLELARVHPPLNDSPNRSRPQDATEAAMQLKAGWCGGVLERRCCGSDAFVYQQKPAGCEAATRRSINRDKRLSLWAGLRSARPDQ